MKKKIAITFLLGLVFSFWTNPVAACTTFCLRDGKQVVFGRNYDWMIGDGMLIVNQRGAAKTAFALSPDEKPARWISKYGSLTFNQYGKEFPTGGVNETGLVVEQMWLDETEYPTLSNAKAGVSVNPLEWIQYQLDNYRSTGEVVRHAANLNLSSAAKLHYLISDRAGNVASVEFLQGKAVVHTGAKLPVPALTNSTYADSLKTWREFSNNQNNSLPPSGAKSLDRFVRAARMVEDYAPNTNQTLTDYAFDILKTAFVKEKEGADDRTQWSVVYDLTKMQVHFKTIQSSNVKIVDLKKLDFSCASPVKMFDINAKNFAGDVTNKFAVYNAESNRALMTRTFAATEFLSGLPPEIIDGFAAHGSAIGCARSKKPNRAARQRKPQTFGRGQN